MTSPDEREQAKEDISNIRDLLRPEFPIAAGPRSSLTRLSPAHVMNGFMHELFGEGVSADKLRQLATIKNATDAASIED